MKHLHEDKNAVLDNMNLHCHFETQAKIGMFKPNRTKLLCCIITVLELLLLEKTLKS